MPTTPIDIVEHRKAVQYTGSNAADIDALITTFLIVSEDAGVLYFESTMGASQVEIGAWVVYCQGMVMHVMGQSELDFVYKRNAVWDDVPEIPPAAPAVRAMGVAPVPTLLFEGTDTIEVTLFPPMPDALYDAYASAFAGVSLDDLSIDSVTVIDENTVEVAVSNVGLATLVGASVLVHAVQ